MSAPVPVRMRTTQPPQSENAGKRNTWPAAPRSVQPVSAFARDPEFRTSIHSAFSFWFAVWWTPVGFGFTR